MPKRTLWYNRCAAHWEEALPLGNGRLGAMVFGNPARERIALNEDTLWSGYPEDRNNPEAAARYPEARRLALAGRLHEAQRLIEDGMLGGFTQSYMPLGDLIIDFEDASPAEDYRRALSLADATHVTRFARGGVQYEMECFASHPAQAFFLRLTADALGALAFSLRLTSPLRHGAMARGRRIDMDVLAPSDVVPSYLDCQDPVRYFDEPERRGMRCRATAYLAACDGSAAAGDGALRVRGASEAVVVLTARTSFRGHDRHPYLDGADEIALCEADLAALSGIRYEDARHAHVADHRALFSRASLSLGRDRYAALPTDERLRTLPEHQIGRASCRERV